MLIFFHASKNVKARDWVFPNWLTHRVHILEANGASYRLKDAKKRLKGS